MKVSPAIIEFRDSRDLIIYHLLGKECHQYKTIITLSHSKIGSLEFISNFHLGFSHARLRKKLHSQLIITHIKVFPSRS